ncbi:MAG: hypothetical protein CFE46_03175 [Burkholderiales bacterium PBB6]|nr:MAG: hypothetical protein CFE46_03175 [Burkholderiales bacterium PBB6]
MIVSNRALGLLRTLGAVMLAGSLLASCGGSTSQLDAFSPSRLVVLGDETSLLRTDGAKYSVNAIDTADADADGNVTEVLCSSKLIWVQSLANYFGLVFDGCKSSTSTATATALNQAAYGAGVAETEAQLKAFNDNIAHDSLGDKDLVTVLVGLHDIRNVYLDGNYATEAQRSAEIAARAKRVAAMVNSIVSKGSKVLVSTAPDIGLSPWALGLGSSEAAEISRHVSTFNTNLRLGLENDGSKIGLLLFDDLVRAAVSLPGTYGFSDVSSLACVDGHRETLLYTCTTATLAATGADTAYLWADGFHVGSTMQSYLGSQAVTRATNNPF